MHLQASPSLPMPYETLTRKHRVRAAGRSCFVNVDPKKGAYIGDVYARRSDTRWPTMMCYTVKEIQEDHSRCDGNRRHCISGKQAEFLA
jgi:hypothetical protein